MFLRQTARNLTDNYHLRLWKIPLPSLLLRVSFPVRTLLNHEATWIEIAIETAVSCGEPQHTIVGIGDAAGIVLLIAIVPDHLFRGVIRQYLHRAPKHHALEAFGIAEIDAGRRASDRAPRCSGRPR